LWISVSSVSQKVQDLLQGDIISRSGELVNVLRKVFPYFCDERYIGFLVTTQSCDLVRRAGKPCRTRYITLAVIRELRLLLPELLEELCGTGVAGVYKKESRYVAEQLLVRIINQNEQTRGLFYLHPDADVRIATPSAAMLRITFSLRRQHYELLTGARCGRVHGEFANKLGWLSGNLFSRVATPDWEDQENDENASSKQAKALLELVTERNGQNWVSEEWIKEAKKKAVDLDNLTPANAYSKLEPHAPPEPIEVVIQRMDAIGREIMAEREVRVSLRRSEEFLRAFAESAVGAVSLLSNGQRGEVAKDLVADGAFCEAVSQAVSSEAKKQFKRLPTDPVTALCEALSAQQGTIRPVLDRLRAVTSSTIGAGDLSTLETDIRAAHLFSPDVLEHVRAIVSAIESEHAERLQQMAARLRNDSPTRTALRRATQVSFAAED